MESVWQIAGSVRFIHPHQLFCFCVLMHQNLHQRQDIVADLSKEPSMKSWRQVFSSEWWEDCFRTVINWIYFVQNCTTLEIVRLGYKRQRRVKGMPEMQREMTPGHDLCKGKIPLAASPEPSR